VLKLGRSELIARCGLNGFLGRFGIYLIALDDDFSQFWNFNLSTSTPGRAVASSLLIALPQEVGQDMPVTSKLTIVIVSPVAGAVLEELPSLPPGAVVVVPPPLGAVSVPPHPDTANDTVAITATAKKLKNLMVFSIRKNGLQPRTISTHESQR